MAQKQAEEFRPKLIAVMNSDKAEELKEQLSKTTMSNIKVISGMEGLVEAATIKSADTVVVSVVGNIGIKPTYEAINCK